MTIDATPAFADPAVARTFAAYPEPERLGLLALRALIFDIAASTAGVGTLQETLKWGQPAYLTAQTKSGSTIRLGLPKHGGFAIYAHCQTSIISEFRELFPDDFAFEGNRAVQFQSQAEIEPKKLSLLIKRALTYRIT